MKLKDLRQEQLNRLINKIALNLAVSSGETISLVNKQDKRAHYFRSMAMIAIQTINNDLNQY